MYKYIHWLEGGMWNGWGWDSMHFFLEQAECVGRLDLVQSALDRRRLFQDMLSVVTLAI